VLPTIASALTVLVALKLNVASSVPSMLNRAILTADVAPLRRHT
jgi:hypothetical protein